MIVPTGYVPPVGLLATASASTLRPKTLVMRKPGPLSQSLMQVKCSSSGMKSSSEPPDVTSPEVVSPEPSPDEVSSEALVSPEPSFDALDVPVLSSADDVSWVEEVSFSLVLEVVEVEAALVVVGAVLVAPVEVLE